MLTYRQTKLVHAIQYKGNDETINEIRNWFLGTSYAISSVQKDGSAFIYCQDEDKPSTIYKDDYVVYDGYFQIWGKEDFEKTYCLYEEIKKEIPSI